MAASLEYSVVADVHKGVTSTVVDTDQSLGKQNRLNVCD